MDPTKITVFLTSSLRITSKQLWLFLNNIVHLFLNRTKDNKFVYCALRKVIASVIERAGQLGVQLTQIVHKSDRPSSQFWNSGMVLAMRELVEEFGIPITHITEQSMHNKVIFTLNNNIKTTNVVVSSHIQILWTT